MPGAGAAPPAAAAAAPPALASALSSALSSKSGAAQNPAELVIRNFVESLARLARSNRDAVREAGGIAPLVTLLRSGTPEVKRLVAAVLRDLGADTTANREAILKVGGLHALVEMARADSGSGSSGEIAGALRSMSNGFPPGCQAILDEKGVAALVQMVEKGEAGTATAIQATGALGNLAQHSVDACEAIRKAGGVEHLVGLLTRSLVNTAANGRRLPVELKQRLEKSAEEAATALYQLAAKSPSCKAAIRKANAIAPLVEAMLRSGLAWGPPADAARPRVEQGGGAPGAPE